MRIAAVSSLLALVAFACQPLDPEDPAPEGIATLGGGTHDVANVNFVVVGDQSDGLNGPRDLDFNPAAPGELWVVNLNDDSTVTWFGLGTDDENSLKIIDPFALHFMEEVSSISFAPNMKFGTCQESHNTYNGQAAGNDFMGPTLWSADLEIYGLTNPEAVDFVGADLGSHLDMLHESPLCMGITWEVDNVYWTFDGLTNSVSRYDFVGDHGAGFDDHSDGIVQRYVEANVDMVDRVPSHLVYDHDTEILFIADTGNGRIKTLDTTTGTEAFPIFAREPGVQLNAFNNATFTNNFITDLELPSGLALHDGVLYVTDNATSRISAFDASSGELIDFLDTGLPEGALMGIRVDAEGNIWGVNFVDNELFRIEAN